MTTELGSPGFFASTGQLTLKKPKRTVMDAYKTTIPGSPEYGFGTSTRPPLNPPTSTPGPGAYPIRTTMNNTVDSMIRSPPMFSLRSRQKFGDPTAKAGSTVTALEPGPGHYVPEANTSIGSASPCIGFPKARPPVEKAELAPGPGSYRPPDSVGKQVLSTKARAPAASLGKGKRPALLQHSTADVGPGEYNSAIAACGPQPDSRKRNPATIKFGTQDPRQARRNQRKLSEPEPGPGSYVIPGGVATSGVGNPYRSSPAASISGRTKFGSPFGW